MKYKQKQIVILAVVYAYKNPKDYSQQDIAIFYKINGVFVSYNLIKNLKIGNKN